MVITSSQRCPDAVRARWCLWRFFRAGNLVPSQSWIQVCVRKCEILGPIPTLVNPRAMKKKSCPTRLTRPSTFVALQYQSFFSVRKRDYFEAVLHLVGPPVLTLLLAPCIGPKPVRSGRKAWFWWENTAAVQKSSLRLFAMALGRFSAIQQRQNSTKIIEKLGARRSVDDGWQLLCSFVCWWLSALERFTEWWKSFD